MQEGTKKILQALAILIGTIVGVGTFGIPYAFSRAGFSVGMLYLAVLAAVVLAIHLIYGEIVLRTPQKHRLIGYADLYLGSAGKRIASVTMLIGLFGALLAYTIVGGAFMKVLIDPFFALGAFPWSIIFFSIMAFFVITDFKTGAPAELVMNAVLLGIFVLIIGRTMPDISFPNLSFPRSFADVFLPYGVTLFALGGSAAIPELRDVLTGDGKMKKVIIVGTLIPVALYAFFAFGVVGVFGLSTTSDAVTSLASRYGTWMAVAGGLVGALTTATSFIVLALVLKHAFMYDFKMPRWASTLTVLAVPLLLFLFATHDFVRVIGFTGGVLGGIEGMLMLYLHRAARAKGLRQPEYSLRIPSGIYYFMGVLFAAGIIYEILYTAW